MAAKGCVSRFSAHVGLTSEVHLIADLAAPFLDDRAPPPLTGFFEGMDAPPAQALGESNRQ
jgi:hypothetical protein